MRRLIAATLVVLLAVPLVAAGAQTNASITDVTISPQSPAPNESITFTPTIRNLQGSGGALVINSVELRSGSLGGLPVYTRAKDVGTLSPGAEVEVPLTHAFSSPGNRNLGVHVDGKNANTGEQVELRYPVSFSVRERHPQVALHADDSVASVASNGTVEIANGLDTSISNVEVTVSSENATILDGRSVFASISQGDAENAKFRFRPKQAGTDELRATVSYTLPSGTERTVTQTQTIETEAARDSFVLETSQSGTGSENTLTVKMINQGNTPAEDVVITARSENATISQAIVGSVQPSSTERVQLDATLSAPSADVVVTAEYESGSVKESVSTRKTIRATPATFELTGLDTARENGLLQITGSTSNVGTTTAQSVIIRVLPGENIEPAPPNKDFFIGEVPGSDFSSFDLTARTSGNVSEVPLEVSYLVDGERLSQTFSVSVNQAQSAQSDRQTGGGSGAGLLAVLGLGTVAVFAIAGLLVRRYQLIDYFDQ